jgi:hypothetical protein
MAREAAVMVAVAGVGGRGGGAVGATGLRNSWQHACYGGSWLRPDSIWRGQWRCCGLQLTTHNHASHLPKHVASRCGPCPRLLLETATELKHLIPVLAKLLRLNLWKGGMEQRNRGGG